MNNFNYCGSKSLRLLKTSNMENDKNDENCGIFQLEQLNSMPYNWVLPLDDENGESLQSVHEQDSQMPFLHGSNVSTDYPTLESTPNWMNISQVTELSNVHITSEASSPYAQSDLSPAPLSTESFTFYDDNETFVPLVTKQDENFTNIISRIGVSEKKILDFNVKELNRFLKSLGLSKEEQKCLKNRRRTLKNRSYAQNCRLKRIGIRKGLEKENEDLRKEVDEVKARLEMVKRERDVYKRQCDAFKYKLYCTL